MNGNLQSMTAAIAAIVLIAAAAWWLFSDESVWPGEVPTCSGKPVQRLIAVLPPIGDFDHEFNVNDDNPFLPLKVRQRDAALRKIKRLQPQSQTPSKPVEVTEVVIPKLVLPTAAPRRKNAPECFGVIGSDRGTMVLARMPGSQEARQLEIGDSIVETEDKQRAWTFIGLDSPNMARFKDPAGEEQIFRVGPSLTAKAAGSSAPAPTKPLVKPAPSSGNALPAPNAQRPPGGRRGQPVPGQPQQPSRDGMRPPNWSPRPTERPQDETGQPVQAPIPPPIEPVPAR
jgi:hypothetical protein